ncbi:hypothetical protein [Methylobacterium iners]|uniref:Uncharacterized protein n=1 Tax=Methylobacterium iners TaxID=418707 RepID=A0ABQ4S514_9HYPH|nr:hypothetical protein [Methylobacterium iners]GJD97492.1 hypothetical protein OCOJLMKI_4723 [Methylobacterium iners]
MGRPANYADLPPFLQHLFDCDAEEANPALSWKAPRPQVEALAPEPVRREPRPAPTPQMPPPAERPAVAPVAKPAPRMPAPRLPVRRMPSADPRRTQGSLL